VHDDHFPPDSKDEDWLPEVGRRGWLVLTKDQKIRYHNVERTALMKSGVASFVMTSGDLQGHEMANIFVRALPAMARFRIKHRPPFIAKVTRDGGVSLLLAGK
jgi:hypothetical protein